MSSSSSPSLKLQHFPAGPTGFFRSPVLLSDSSTALLIDGGFSFPDGELVANAIANSGKKLTSIYISQSDPDYYFSVLKIKNKFPDAVVLSSESTLSAIEASVQSKIDVWAPQLKENGPQSMADIVLPRVHKGDLQLNEETIHVIDTPLANRRYLWSHTLKALFGGVLVFSDVHVWMADLPSVEQRSKWIEILNEMIERKPHTVIPGHMQLNSPIDASSLVYTKNYLIAFEEERLKAKNSTELIEAMKGRYPAAGMEIALEIGAKVIMGEMKWG